MKDPRIFVRAKCICALEAGNECSFGSSVRALPLTLVPAQATWLTTSAEHCVYKSNRLIKNRPCSLKLVGHQIKTLGFNLENRFRGGERNLKTSSLVGEATSTLSEVFPWRTSTCTHDLRPMVFYAREIAVLNLIIQTFLSRKVTFSYSGTRCQFKNKSVIACFCALHKD